MERGGAIPCSTPTSHNTVIPVHSLDLILTLTGGFAAALVFGYATHRLGLSPIVGYLLAGVMVSPHTPGFVANTELANQLAEIGVILLMFGVGLQFHFKEFLEVRKIAIPGALIQSLGATAIGAVVMHALGWDWVSGIVFGLALSVASTVVLTRVLSDNNDLHTKTGHIAIGWLVMEDLFTVFVLVLLPAIFGTAALGAMGVLTAGGIALVKIIVLGVIMFVFGGWIIPRVLTNIAKTGSRELFTLAVLAIAMSIAVGASFVFDVSMALGAFLAGMVVGRSEFSLRAATEALPLRDAFAVLFFVSVGMLFDWVSLIEAPLYVIATLIIILIGKPLIAFLVAISLRYPLRTSLSVAIVLSQIGEFSFILATMGTDLNILPKQASNILVAAAIISITLNPMLYRAVRGGECWMHQHTPALTRLIDARCDPVPDEEPAEDGGFEGYRAIVVGYGPVGQTVTRLLRENSIQLTIIELNIQTVQSLKEQGIKAIYGDATNIDTLTKAGVSTAAAFVISIPTMKGSSDIVRQVRVLNPHIRIIVRTEYLSEQEELRNAGAYPVFSDEGEVALSMTESILKLFGATPEQIERERDRVHTSLLQPLLPPEPDQTWKGRLVSVFQRDKP
jgi:monovalent cation:H+ antiporter-2, CPA2 family